MKRNRISEKQIAAFRKWLVQQEKKRATIEKYVRDVRAFHAFARDRSVTKELTMAYKRKLTEEGYAPHSINSMLASMNCFLCFLGREECKVKSVKLQRQIYCAEEKELTKEEYMKLLTAAGKRTRLALILQTICGTGIRISELSYFTVEAIRRGEVSVSCKNKVRRILIPKKLQKMLLSFSRESGIASGVIFRSRYGNPLDRSNIWAEMKRLCRSAGVDPAKVFPHNLRKLFARTFYGLAKDIAKLSDILGHSSINTTRIYIMTTGTEHRRQIERLGLVV